MTIALCATVMAESEKLTGENVEMIAVRHSDPGSMDAYERVLGDALAGDATHFARQDYVEEAWRIVEPVLKTSTPLYEYDKGTWGPSEADHKLTPHGGWHNPVVPEEEEQHAAAGAR
jgi:glucose-6-phosphate 1-dehydrogenase